MGEPRRPGNHRPYQHRDLQWSRSLMPDKGWQRRFDEPIELPSGRKLLALHDAATYATKLAKAGFGRCRMAGRDRSADPGRDGGRTDDVRADRRDAGLEPEPRSRVQSGSERSSLGKAEAEEGPMKTVWIYVNTNKDVGDVDHLKVFASEEAAEKWLAENDPEGVAFAYPVIGAGEE
jgi:hypothetical protein